MMTVVQPQAKELEEAVLGAILLEKSAIDTVSDLLSPEVFYLEKHQLIYKSVQQLYRVGQPIDIFTVVEELKSQGTLEAAGGPYYVTRLTNSVVSSAHIEAHARIVVQRYMQRQVIRIGRQMTVDGADSAIDVFDLLDNIEEQLMAIELGPLRKDYVRIDHGLVKVIHRLETLRMMDQSVTGVPTGFIDLDRCTHGWQDSDLIILAARPSVGKTAFALNLARNAALHPEKPTPVAFFSLEMSRDQLIQRLLSAESDVFLDKITSGRIDEYWMRQIYQRGVRQLERAPIYIDDTAGLTMFELRAKARRLKNKLQIGLIIVDYLQLMTGDINKSDNREREISKISRELKKLAKDLNIPIIALSQLSREIEKRGKGQKVPQLSDLRESGAIEQDADVVVFLYRPSEDEVLEDRGLENRGMVKIAKHRNGKLDEIVLKFFGETQKWLNLEDADRYESKISLRPLAKSDYQADSHSEPAAKDDGPDDLPF
jgi:replicative DNA helicase